MGHKRRRKDAFFAEHPKCCYCGGILDATTVDHWPSRALFSRREWPEGYAFPACFQCNNESSDLEGLFAVICRLGSKVKQEDEENQRLQLGALSRHPEAYNSLFISADEKRQRARKYGIEEPLDGGWDSIPMVALDHPTVQRAMHLCSQKLLLSLHYKHSTCALDSRGLGVYRWFTNLDASLNAVFENLGPTLHQRIEPMRGRVSLSRQFGYSFSLYRGSDGPSSSFLISHGAGLSLFGMLFPNGAALSGAPFEWGHRFGPLRAHLAEAQSNPLEQQVQHTDSGYSH